MVSEPNAFSNQNEQDSSDNGLPPIEIEDTTSEEVLRQEEAFFAGEDISEAEADAGTPGVAEGTVDETPPEAELPPVQEPESRPEEPQRRTFSEEEWRKMQSSYDRQVAELTKKQQALERQYQEQQVSNQVEAELRRQEQSLAQTVGAEEASRLVRDQNNVNSVRDAYQARSELEQLRNERNQYASQSRMATMNNWITSLKQQHSLSDADVQTLQGLAATATGADDNAYVQTGEMIGQLAARLAASGQQRSVASEERRKLVPRETPETALESGQSVSRRATTEADLRASARTKMPVDWSPEEHAAMRRIAGV